MQWRFGITEGVQKTPVPRLHCRPMESESLREDLGSHTFLEDSNSTAGAECLSFRVWPRAPWLSPSPKGNEEPILHLCRDFQVLSAHLGSAMMVLMSASISWPYFLWVWGKTGKSEKVILIRSLELLFYTERLTKTCKNRFLLSRNWHSRSSWPLGHLIPKHPASWRVGGFAWRETKWGPDIGTEGLFHVLPYIKPSWNLDGFCPYQNVLGPK